METNININERTNLDDAEIERLAILIEECAEVQQIACKILRHGYFSYSPFDDTKTSNKELLEKEIGDLEFTIKLMCDYNDLERFKIGESANKKADKIQPYIHFNKLNP